MNVPLFSPTTPEPMGFDRRVVPARVCGLFLGSGIFMPFSQM